VVRQCKSLTLHAADWLRLAALGSPAAGANVRLLLGVDEESDAFFREPLGVWALRAAVRVGAGRADRQGRLERRGGRWARLRIEPVEGGGSGRCVREGGAESARQAGMGDWRWSEGGLPKAGLKERGRRAWMGLQELVVGGVVGGVGLVEWAGGDGRGEGVGRLRWEGARWAASKVGAGWAGGVEGEDGPAGGVGLLLKSV